MAGTLYQPQADSLDGGLDLITPKVAVQGGTLSGGLNFERTDRQGYSRIAGYEPFDGGALASLAYTNLVYLNHNSNSGTTSPRTALQITGDTDIVGTVVLAGATKTLIAVTNYNEWRYVLAAINAATAITLNAAPSGDTFVVNTVTSFNDNNTLLDAKALTLLRNTYYKNVSALTAAPGITTNPVIGLHGYKNQIYAIKNLPTYYFTGGTAHIVVRGGDLIRPHVDATNARAVRALEFHTLAGTWAAGTITGVFEGNPTAAVPTGAYDLVSAAGAVLTANVLNVASPPLGTDMTAWGAGWYRSNIYTDAPYSGGWQFVDLGYTFNFNNGSIYGPPHTARRGTFSSYTTDVTPSPGHGTVGTVTNGSGGAAGTWTVTPVGNVPAATNNASGTTNNVLVVMAGTVAATTDPILKLRSFDFPNFAIDPNTTIQGMEVQFRLSNSGSPSTYGVLNLQVQPTTAGAAFTPAPGTNPETINIPYEGLTTKTMGSPTDTWGLTSAGLKALLDTSTFGIAVTPQFLIADATRSNNSNFRMFDVKVVIYLTQTVTQYYFWNGADDVIADITYVYTSSGDWTTGDAAGSIQVTNVAPVPPGTRTSIRIGDQIRTSPAGAGLLVAVVTSDMVFNGLDTLASLETAKSRYEFITSNFFADENFEAIYGVSGAGRAFSYDGFYFTRIFTQTDPAKDKPRHVADHQFHLALGYKAGAVLLSVAGNPLDYSGVNGASEIDTGDPIMGFARMQGTTLGIFCKKTIQGLVGTSPDNFSLGVLGPYEGAIEYTVCDIGKPIYTSYKGISVFDQTAAYGDFQGQRLSYPVTPWLAPRLQGTVSPLGSIGASAGPVVAIPCRTKNQYRLYFGDGYRLTMTLAGPDQTPMFTFQAECLYDSGGNALGYVVPRAESSFIDDSGAERIHISHYSKAVPLPVYHVYEYERSWTFDGTGIASYLLTNENFIGGAFSRDIVRKLRLHGLSMGYAPISVRVGKDYNSQNSATIQIPRQSINVSIPYAPDARLQAEFVPVTTLNSFATEGKSFSMRIMSYGITAQPATFSDPVYADVCPPFVLQAMLTQFADTKGDN